MTLGFETTPTGYRATDAQVTWWQQRDTCPACQAVHSPVETTEGRDLVYQCDCNGEVRWTRPATPKVSEGRRGD